MGKLLPTVGIEGRLSSLKQVLEPVDYLAEEIGYLPEEVLALPGLLFAAFGAYAVVTVVMSGMPARSCSFEPFVPCPAAERAPSLFRFTATPYIASPAYRRKAASAFYFILSPFCLR